MDVVPKIRIAQKLSFPDHRSGWGFALAALEPLCTPSGIYADTFIEANFGWDLENARQRGLAPYQEPWIGFVHNPPGIPEWHEYYSTPQEIFASAMWRESVDCCRGLITLSEWMADWLRSRTSLPVLALVHPTESPERRFDWDAYTANPEPRIIQVGWWLRRFHSIHQLDVRRHKPSILVPVRKRLQDFRDAIAREALYVKAAPPGCTVDEIPYQDADGFDRLLSENLVFMDLYDSVCNNSLVECIVRNTPALVNPLPSVVEYLGADYPMYFADLEEASRKAEDRACVLAAHQYLSELPKERFTAEYFRDSLARSDFYREL